MNKALLGTMMNASGLEKNLTWLYHCSKELLLTLKMKYDLLYFYVTCLFYALGRKIFLELRPSVQPSDIAVL